MSLSIANRKFRNIAGVVTRRTRTRLDEERNRDIWVIEAGDSIVNISFEILVSSTRPRHENALGTALPNPLGTRQISVSAGTFGNEQALSELGEESPVTIDAIAFNEELSVVEFTLTAGDRKGPGDEVPLERASSASLNA